MTTATAPRTEFPSRLAFATWLSIRPADELVGVCGDAGKCPLAEFLASACGIPKARVHGDRWLERPGGPYLPVPEWAQCFEAAVDDRLPVASCILDDCGISAAECLAILRGIQP